MADAGWDVRFVWPSMRRPVVRGTVVRGTVVPGAVTGVFITVGILASGGQAQAATATVQAAPLTGSASATLTQANTAEWTTTVYLDTAALCAGKNPAGNKFSLVTGKPTSVTDAAAPAYPDGPLACDAVAANPVTEVKLTFAPSLSAVPQTATLIVTPPQALLLAGDTPMQVPLTVRRIVSPWQYVGIPAICGGALAGLLVAVLLVIGLPDKRGKRVRGLDFWRTPLFARVAWSFGDSWATSVTPLTALAGGVLTASGAVAGLVPGVDLTRIGLLMTLTGGLTTLAPLVFSALNSVFPERRADEPVPPGEVIAASLWVMLLASCLTVFAIGAEIGFVGLVLGFNLIVVSPSIRWIGPAATVLAALLFLAYGAHSILTLAGQPSGIPKATAKKSSFMI